VFAVGDALGDALVRPDRVVVHLVFSQDGEQMTFAEDAACRPSSSTMRAVRPR